MNRFEQNHSKYIQIILSLLPAAGAILVLLAVMTGLKDVSATTIDKQQTSLETALSRGISQCYAVEGSYPVSLDYLVDHYGLLYDSETFFVDYIYYGSNLYPDVTVLPRTQVLDSEQ